MYCAKVAEVSLNDDTRLKNSSLAAMAALWQKTCPPTQERHLLHSLCLEFCIVHYHKQYHLEARAECTARAPCVVRLCALCMSHLYSTSDLFRNFVQILNLKSALQDALDILVSGNK